MKDDYQDFLDEYMLGSSRMIEAAASGYRLDPGRCLPDGSFPPAVIESLLKVAGGFNPETAFPARCFPRAWPFIGGELPAPPPTPPSRPLVLRQVGEELEIVWRGEIPTVHVPRREDTRPSLDTMVCDHSVPLRAKQIARGDPVRDPP